MRKIVFCLKLCFLFLFFLVALSHGEKVRVALMFSDPVEVPELGEFGLSFFQDWKLFEQELALAGGIPRLYEEDATELEFVWVKNQGLNQTVVENNVADLCAGAYDTEDLEVLVVLAGFGSTISGWTLDSLHQCFLETGRQFVTFAPSGSSETLYICGEEDEWCETGARRFPNVWGMAMTGELQAEGLFNVFLLEKPAKVGMYCESQVYNLELQNWLVRFYTQIASIELAAGDVIEGPFFATEESLNEAIAHFRQRDVDVAYFSINPNSCELLHKALVAADWFPKGFSASLCRSSVYEADWRYNTGTLFFDPRLRGISYVESNAAFPSFFCSSESNIYAPEVYWNKTLETFPTATQTTVSGLYMGALYALANAITRIEGTITYDKIGEEMFSVAINSFMGRIQFDSFGRLGAIDEAMEQTNKEYFREILFPLNARTANLVYPAPSWCQRDGEINDWFTSDSEIVMTVFVALGACIALAFAVVTMMNARNPTWSYYCPWSMVIAFVGIALVNISLIFWMLYATDGTCITLLWMLSTGFLVLFSALLCRILISLSRLHEKLLGRINQPSKILIVCLLLGVFIPLLVFVLPLSVVDDALSAKLVVKSEDILSENYWECQASDTGTVLLSLFLGFGGLLVLCCCVFVYILRKSHDKREHTSVAAAASIGYGMFTVLICFLIVVILESTNALERKPAFITRSTLIFISMLAMSFLIFVPHIYYTYLKAEDDSVGHRVHHRLYKADDRDTIENSTNS